MDPMHGYERLLQCVSTERIKLQKCAVRDGMREGMKEAEESCLSCLLI